MSLFSYQKFIPNIDENVFLAPGSQIIGNVTISSHSSIWHNSVLRGDVNYIKIGKNSNIQDLSMLHVTEENPLIIGDNVTIGHSVTLHGCTIDNYALIGMGATILDQAQIGEYSIVAAGSVVTPGKKFPPRSMIMGAPAKFVRELRDDEIKMLDQHYLSYVGYAKNFMDSDIIKELEVF